ncbi:MAG: cell division protein FtsL [Candidatus Poribacteria bacterium]|nr:cell division protein FtsL [Candidatus Poribacteria bacterium]
MQNPTTYSPLFNQKPDPEPKVAMLFVYLVLGLSLCVFGASVWFSSYAKSVFLQRKPTFEKQREKIQDEIRKLELEENALTDVERVRSLIKELGLVEPLFKSLELHDR